MTSLKLFALPLAFYAFCATCPVLAQPTQFENLRPTSWQPRLTSAQELTTSAKPVQSQPSKGKESASPPPTSANTPPAPEDVKNKRPETKPTLDLQQTTQQANVSAPSQDTSTRSATQIYCQNIVDLAADARFLAQKAEIAKLEEALAVRIALLEKKKAEYQEWLHKREDFIRKAEDSLVGLYAKVKPDAAASQLAAMDEEPASAILFKLSPRNASAILDQMEPAKAARLASILVGAARRPDQVSSRTDAKSVSNSSTPSSNEPASNAGEPKP